MSVDAQLLYESRVRMRQAMVAGATAVLLVAAAVSQLAGPQPKVDELTIGLINAHQRAGGEIIGAVLEAVALIGLVWTLLFLFRIARARRPETTPLLAAAVIVGGAIAGIGGIVYAGVLLSKAAQFVAHGSQTYEQAHQLVGGTVLPVLQFADIFGEFALAVGVVLIALTAMRVGLITRFLGYFGMIVGAVGLFLIGSPPAVLLQVVWLLLLGALFAGRWQGGDPPSWRSGRAEPWPTSAQLREQRTQAAAERGGRGAAAGRAGSRGKGGAGEQPETIGSSPAPRTRSTTSKRKRKRRR